MEFKIRQVTCLVVLVAVVGYTSAQTLNQSKQLMTDMLNGYDTRHRPVADQSQPINVNISFDLVAIQEFNEVEEKFSVVGLVYMVWLDEEINWKPGSYGGIISQMFKLSDVWYPILILGKPYTSIKDISDTDWMTVRYYFSGLAVFAPGTVFKSTCSVDITYYPFDTQRCELILIPWGYSEAEITLTPTDEKVKLTYYSENGEWELIDSQLTVGDSVMLTVSFTMKRKPMFLVVNVILPILFMAVINILVFFLPAESGERVSYSVTVLLALAVFLTLVGDNLPKTSQPMAILSYYLMATLITSVLMCVTTILNLNLYYRKSDVDVPHWCASMTRILKLSCHRKSRASPRRSIRPLQMDELSDDVEKENNRKQGLYIKKKETKTDEKINVTWQEVSVAVDKISIAVFFLMLLIVNTVFLSIMVNNK